MLFFKQFISYIFAINIKLTICENGNSIESVNKPAIEDQLIFAQVVSNIMRNNKLAKLFKLNY